MMCAGYPGGGVDSCIGDTGGPMMTIEDGFYKLCGLISFGKGCGWADYFGGYSRVCTVIDWVNAYLSGTSTIASGSTTTIGPIETTEWPDNQEVTPKHPTPSTTSTCGHSQYYFGSNEPGIGIVGGVSAEPNEYPWIVRLQIGSDFCSGTIVGSKHILTAGHCAYGIDATEFKVFFGEHDIYDYDYNAEFSRNVTSVTIHEFYDDFSFDYDFALLEIEGDPLDFTLSWNVQKICLPTSCDDGCAANTLAYIAGWGATFDGGSGTSTLERAYVKIQDQSVCQSQFDSGSITDRMICAGYIEGGIDSCQGDSGGPLMTIEDGFFKACGISSWGDGCAKPDKFGVYSKVCTIVPWLSTII